MTARSSLVYRWRPFSILLGLSVALAILSGVGLAADGPGNKLFFTAYGLEKEGKLTEAAAVYEAGLKAEPKNAMAHYFLGNIYAQLGNSAGAKTHLSQSLKLDPQGPYSGKAQARLGQLSQGTVKSAGKAKAPGSVFRDCPTCPDMVVIPAGTFIMGSPPSEGGHQDDETPTHTVTIGQAFAMAKTEVTRGQFAAFVSETGYQAGESCTPFGSSEWKDRLGRNWQNPGFPQDDSHPAVCLSWNDAKAYADWLSRKSGKPYRLPSEAEWEYAARAGTTTARFWGESPDQACTYANVMDSTGKAQVPGVTWEAHNCTDNQAYTAPVGSFKPNSFGLYDMIGNAWEWVEDCVHENYTGAPGDGSAWIAGQCEKRVLRGGSWNFIPQNTRSASCFRNVAAFRFIYIGFRLARMLP